MLTSPLASRQEPFGRSVDVRPLGWRPSPKRYKPDVKQAEGDDSQCVGHSDRSQPRTREPFPAQAESERMA
jgi:hypothetical protein